MRITSNLSDVQFYEIEQGSGEACNIKEYGFVFIEKDANNAEGSKISQGNQQRQISKIEVSEGDKEIQSEIVTFAKEVGINFDIPHVETMFAKGMGVSDSSYYLKLDGERLRSELTEDGKEQRKQEIAEQNKVRSQKYKQRCADALQQITKLRGET